MKFEFKIISSFDGYRMIYKKLEMSFYDSPNLNHNYDYKQTTTYSERFIKLIWPGWKV